VDAPMATIHMGIAPVDIAATGSGARAGPVAGRGVRRTSLTSDISLTVWIRSGRTRRTWDDRGRADGA